MENLKSMIMMGVVGLILLGLVYFMVTKILFGTIAIYSIIILTNID